MRKASVQIIVDWIHDARNEVQTVTIQKSFRKCGIQNEMDGTEDDDLWVSTNSK